jgi:hypothetical protein
MDFSFLYSSFLNYFDLFIDYLPICPIRFHPFCHILEGPLDIRGVLVDHGTGNDCLLPHILPVRFCHGDVKLAPEAVQQGLEPAALFF